MPQATNTATQAVLPGRVSYPAIWEKTTFKDQENKYQLTLLIPKSDKAAKAKMDACIAAAKIEAKDKVFKGTLPKVLDLPIHDGDEDFEKDLKGEEYKGHWYITAKSKEQVVVFDEAGNEMLKQSGFYAGCYAKIAVNFYGYDNRGKGIAVNLNGIKKTGDGEAFSSKPSVAQVAKMFEDDGSDLV